MPRAPIRSVLVVSKKSAWEQHVVSRGRGIDPATRRTLLEAHRDNERALSVVRRALDTSGVPYRTTGRAELQPGRRPNGEPDLVISVGGDGTFLEASHLVKRGRLLGVNSSPAHSVGFFCAADAKSFPAVLERALADRLPETRLQRLEVRVGKKLLPMPVLNDVLITHANPGATSRYMIEIGDRRETHRSSGIWIATAAGSTAGIRAAGGALLPIRSDRFQYAVRELYVPPGVPERTFRLRKGLVRGDTELRIVGRMVNGLLFVDGPRHKVSLRLGEVIRIRISPVPLRALGLRPRGISR